MLRKKPSQNILSQAPVNYAYTIMDIERFFYSQRKDSRWWKKIFSILWNAVNPQKDLDKQSDRLTKANISKKAREELLAEVTRATIVYGLWELALFTLIIIFVGIYIVFL